MPDLLVNCLAATTMNNCKPATTINYQQNQKGASRSSELSKLSSL